MEEPQLPELYVTPETERRARAGDRLTLADLRIAAEQLQAQPYQRDILDRAARDLQANAETAMEAIMEGTPFVERPRRRGNRLAWPVDRPDHTDPLMLRPPGQIVINWRFGFQNAWARDQWGDMMHVQMPNDREGAQAIAREVAEITARRFRETIEEQLMNEIDTAERRGRANPEGAVVPTREGQRIEFLPPLVGQRVNLLIQDEVAPIDQRGDLQRWMQRIDGRWLTPLRQRTPPRRRTARTLHDALAVEE